MKESAGKGETEMVHRRQVIPPHHIESEACLFVCNLRSRRGWRDELRRPSKDTDAGLTGQRVAGHKIESETGDVQPRKCRQVAGHDASSWSKTVSPHCTAQRDKQSIPAKREGESEGRRAVWRRRRGTIRSLNMKGNDGPLFPLEDSDLMVNLSAKRYTVLGLPAANSSVSRDDDVQADHACSTSPTMSSGTSLQLQCHGHESAEASLRYEFRWVEAGS
ncbi:uncharacterized protein UDID_02417 [Ustilago sp. UG-2017a]|nr:uncharacterized protein UDID_02417 [Ustilago sp. UG-2017a]